MPDSYVIPPIEILTYLRVRSVLKFAGRLAFEHDMRL